MDIAVRMTRPGGAEVLEVVPAPPEAPGPGEVRIRHEAIGVNFIDIYHRIGLYPLPVPAVIGVEGAGVVEAVGAGVTALSAGDRVAYAGAPVGAYSSTRLLRASRAIRLPEGLSPTVAGTSMLRGLTAHMLLTRTYPVGPGSVLLVHAAAGGLGMLLVGWAVRLGAIVIGTVSTEGKAELARSAGASHVIVGRDADVAGETRRLTGGRGVDFAIDGIGGDMLAATIGAVRPFGVVASIGEAAGPIPPLAVTDLGPRRSLSLARPSVMAYSAEPETYVEAAAAAFEAMQAGLCADVRHQYGLAEAAEAHRQLGAGRTTGTLMLRP